MSLGNALRKLFGQDAGAAVEKSAGTGFGPINTPVGVKCPRCGVSGSIVTRYGKYHHNACGFEWDIEPKQAPIGQRAALDFDERTTRAVNANLERNPFCSSGDTGSDLWWPQS